VARLLIEFFHASDRALIGYDLNPREPTLAGRFPHLVWPWTSPKRWARWSCSTG
jgi:hypothetical protein